MTIGYTEIVGKFTRAIDDGADGDRNPDRVPLAGLTFEFLADLKPAVGKDTAAGSKETIYLGPYTATANEQGILIGPDGQPGVRLIAADSDTIEPKGWTYTVTVKGSEVPTLKKTFGTSAGQTIDFSDIVPLPPSPGNQIPEWTAVVSQVTAAASDAQAAQLEAESAAASVQRDQPNGVAPLDSSAKVPDAKLPTRLSEAGLSATFAGVTAIDEDARWRDNLAAWWANVGSGLGWVHGDSFTQGTLPSQIGLKTGLSIVGTGYGGQTSTQIAARVGAIPTLVTLAGPIPTSGYVVISEATVNIATSPAGNVTQLGSLAGVPGNFSYTGTEMRFTPTEYPAAPVTVAPRTPFRPDIAKYSGRVVFLWAHQNDPDQVAPAQTVANLKAMAAMMGGPNRKVIILEACPHQSRKIGTPQRASFDAIRAAVAAAFPRELATVFTWLMTDEAFTAAEVTKTADDATDITAGIVPRSLRSDDIHLTDQGRAAAAFFAGRTAFQRGITTFNPPLPLAVPANGVTGATHRYNSKELIMVDSTQVSAMKDLIGTANIARNAPGNIVASQDGLQVLRNPGVSAKLTTAANLGLSGAFTAAMVIRSLHKGTPGILTTPGYQLRRITNGNWQAAGAGSTGEATGTDGWTHVVLVADGASTALYVNGVAAPAGAVTGPGSWLSSTTLELFTVPNAIIDVVDITLWPFAMTAGQVATERAAMKAGYAVLP